MHDDRDFIELSLLLIEIEMHFMDNLKMHFDNIYISEIVVEPFTVYGINYCLLSVCSLVQFILLNLL